MRRVLDIVRVARHVVVLCVGLTPAVVSADSGMTALERSVKAAFLYKFAAYVAWPAHAMPISNSPITIGIVGDEDMVAELRRLVLGRTVEGRTISVQSLVETDPLGNVQILYLSRSVSARLEPLIRSLQSQPVLVVTDARGALSEGSMINFVLREGRVRFEISLAAARKSGLNLSSRLLGVAQTVITRQN